MPDKDRTSGYLRPELETMDPQARQDYLDGRVAATVAHAHERAPGFQARMEAMDAEPGDITSVADLAKLPVVEKAELINIQRENLPFGGLMAGQMEHIRRIYVSPGPIYEPAERTYADDRWAQALYAGGFRAGDIAQVTFNFNLVPFAFNLDESLNSLGCVSVPAGVGNTELQVQIMKDLGVAGYLGTPSFLSALADKAEALGMDLKKDLNLQVAFVAAEALPSSLRKELEERLGMLVRQSYGTAELNCLSYECMEMGGMHLAQDCVVQICDPETGQEVEPGQVGEVVATIFDHTYPLIRLGTGDLSSLTYDACACGRTAPKMTGWLGRVDQVTKVRGMFVHPSNVQQVAQKFPQVEAFQLVVTRENNQDVMTLVCELAEPGADREELRAGLENELKETLRVKGRVDFQDQGSLPEGCKVIDDQRTWD
ncbi:MAG: AMP-binding protein [Desulfarculaceae bacterium]|nr:AMP-binding protein [Desulfarculaceae bacterium]MCF8072283.1 AMP-binding protein [Desulfarculaceae bacterium]MCF8100204.1 AMP-binding protein [Desulfarculaceae bacterium]MCF8116223.1 AMP-binding protein [Desulfarculaceae bacterium]